MVCEVCSGTGWEIFYESRNVVDAVRCECTSRRRMEREYKCEKCGSTGMIKTQRDIMVSHARRCQCRIKAGHVYKLKNFAVPERYKHCSIDNYFPESPAQKIAHMTARTFVGKYERDGSGIIFYGPQKGRGKTHLAVACVKELINRYNVNGVFIDFSHFCNLIQMSYSQDSGEDSELYDRVLGCDVLLIDDFGSMDPKSLWRRDTFYYLINQRYMDRKALVLTSCLMFEDSNSKEQGVRSLQSGIDDGRSYSRICEIMLRGRRVFVGGGKDYRMIS